MIECAERLHGKAKKVLHLIGVVFCLCEVSNSYVGFDSIGLYFYKSSF